MTFSAKYLTCLAISAGVCKAFEPALDVVGEEGGTLPDVLPLSKLFSEFKADAGVYRLRGSVLPEERVRFNHYTLRVRKIAEVCEQYSGIHEVIYDLDPRNGGKLLFPLLQDFRWSQLSDVGVSTFASSGFRYKRMLTLCSNYWSAFYLSKHRLWRCSCWLI
ncbi:hypothetical protein SCP_1403370 [Sparassis crispa]|uniref:Uncharacterized protein n=1 Tax=Sparassis crispa TaxID=139825 RepID=A0A401H3G5_9APHY|nr:hypothetical protein SCP_1403370 [Sparassis crispa]GBE88929.1 hypothetical protein SCP_1403370 [Sparassis crispa]